MKITMSTAKKVTAIILSSLLASVIIMLLIMAAPMTSEQGTGSDTRVSLTSDTSEMLDIVKDGSSDFSVIFAASDSLMIDTDLASKIESRIYELGAMVQYYPDSFPESEHEILLGVTNRAFSKELDAQVQELAEEYPYVWIIAERDGKLALVANCAEAFDLGGKDLLALIGETDFSVPKGMMAVSHIDEDQFAEIKEEERLQYVASLRDMNAEFTEELFGKNEYKPMIGENGYYQTNPKSEPWVYPTEDTHPRYLTTAGDIERIKEILADPAYKNLSDAFWQYANSTVDEHHFGVFPEVRGKSGEIYRYDEKILAMIDAKALAYLITGEEQYALEAIISIKNAVLTLKFTKDIHGDVYHGPSHVMVELAAVYDWCYDAMTESDKWQLIYATATKLAPGLEQGMQYPPYGMSPVSGHGTGPQLLRDWMTVSVVFYDEAPDWWSFVGGRYFQEYLPVANYAYQSGWVSQGTATYGNLKIAAQAWAALLIKTSTGENFFTEDGADTMRYLLSHMMSNGRYFQTGDGPRSSDGTQITFSDYFIVAALFDDPVLYAMGREFSKDHTEFFYTQDPGYNSILTMTPAFQLALAASIDYNGEAWREETEIIQYFGYPATQMTARESWDDPDSVAIMMRIGNLTMANHDIYDHGTFQIYYKGLLAGSSGIYNGYGMPAHYYYHQATVAQNGLLIFNPSFAAAEPIYDESKPVTSQLTNASSYYYSGGQERRNEAGSFEQWTDGSYDMAQTLGAAWGYNSDGTPKYAYVAGDLTSAYNAATVDYVARRMLTVFTSDPDYPAIFITFDQITSDSENYEKSWLLHVVKKPTVDAENKKATVVNGDGKMYVYSLFGGDVLESVGGEGKAYWINGYYDNDGKWIEGKDCLDKYTTQDYWETIWGRIQIRDSGEKKTELLTMMAITDTSNERELELDRIESETALGVKVDGKMILFSRAEDLNFKEITLTTEGKGLYEYFVTGLEEGTWVVSVDGVRVASAYSDGGEALISFVAPTGNITITPGNDVIGANGGKIQYNTGGATLPDDAPYSYRNETATPLPTDVVRDDDIFLGWYTTPTYDEGTEIAEIPEGTTGLIKLYAKWFCTFVDEDFSDVDIDLKASTSLENGITYQGTSKEGSSFITKTDENGVRYLEWIAGVADPLICQKSAVKNYANMVNEDQQVSLTFSFSLNEGSNPIESHVRLIAKQNVDGATIPGTATILFQTSASGNVTAADGKPLAVLSNDEITNIRVLLDFKKGEMRFFDDTYNVIHTIPIVPPTSTGATTAEEFRTCLTEYLWYWYGGTSNKTAEAGLRVYHIRAVEGDDFSDKRVEKTEGIKYNTGGALLPKDAPEDFAEVGATLLPENITLDGCTFGGWYTSPNFEAETRVYAVPEGTTGIFEVYARWHRVFANEDYSDKDIDLDNTPTEINGINYAGNLHPGASFKTETDGDGVKYLVWNVGTEDPIINVKNSLSNISVMTSDTVSYTFKFAAHGDAPVPSFGLSVMAQVNTSGATQRTDLTFGEVRDGEIFLCDNAGNSVKIGTVEKDVVTTVRIAINFSDGTVTAYDDEGKVIESLNFAVPAASGATTPLEWKKCFTTYLLYCRHGGSEEDGKAIRIYGIRIAEGNEFVPEDTTHEENDIVYKLNGGTLSDDVPTKYDPALGTELPIPTKSGFLFGGWYTTSTFDEGTSTVAVPAGSTGFYEVHARWYRLFANEDYSDKDIDIDNTPTEINGINYAGNFHPGASFKTETDGDGVKYLVWNVGTEDPIINVTNSYSNISVMTSDTVSYTFKFAAHGDAPVPSFGLSVMAQVNTSGAKQRTDLVFGEVRDGEILLCDNAGNSVKIGTVEKDVVTTVRIAINFGDGTVTAYDGEGKVIESLNFAVPAASGATTPLEWKKCFTTYLLYCRHGGSEEDGKAIRIYGIRIEEGNAFVDESALGVSNTIVYNSNGATLPEDAPTEYDTEVGTALPELTRDGFVFGGWYTSSDFSEASRVETVGKGMSGTVTVYALWLRVYTENDFENTSFDVGETTAINYDGSLGVRVTAVGSKLKTVTDEQGNKYIKVTVTSGDALLLLQNDANNLTNMSSDVLSIRLDLLPVEGVLLMDTQIKIATSGNTYGQLQIANVNPETGDINLVGNDVPFANVLNEKVTVRIAINFKEGKVYAYNEAGEVISETVPAVPSTLVTSLDQWRHVARNYLLYVYMFRPGASAEDPAEIGIDNVSVTEGNAFI